MAAALLDAHNFTGDALVNARCVWPLGRRKVYRWVGDRGWSELSMVHKEERPPSRG